SIRVGVSPDRTLQATPTERRDMAGSGPVTTPDPSPAYVGQAAPTAPSQSALVQAALGRPTRHTPVWFMRQAGRSLPEYRALRGSASSLGACATALVATDIPTQPVRRPGVGAAVLCSALAGPRPAIGLALPLVPGVGRVVAEPFAARTDLMRLPE